MRPKMSVPATDVALSALTAVLFWAIVARGLTPLVWIFLCPVFVALARCAQRRAIGAAAALIALCCALGMGAALWWVGRYGLWVLALGEASASAIGLLFFLACLGLWRWPVLRVAGPPLVAAALSLLVALPPLRCGWANLAVFYPLPSPLAGLLGSRGVHALIVLVNWLAALGLHGRSRPLLAGAAALLAVPALAASSGARPVPEGKPLTVALVQGDFPQRFAWRRAQLETVLARYEDLTLSAAKARPDLIVWPEYVVLGDFFRDRALYDRISGLARRIGTHLALGTMTYVDPRRTGDEDVRTDTIVVFGPDGELLARYDSNRPLPFDPMVAPGRGFPVVRLPKGSFTIGVCYEEFSDSPAFSAEADFIVSLSNNNMQDRSPGLELAARFSRLRAVENAKYVVRAANTGVTQVVDPFGKIVSRIPPYRPGILVATIRI